jgi:hypothetical protein
MQKDPVVESQINSAVALFSGSESVSVELRTITVRVNLETLAVVDSMASHAKVTRQLMMSRLLSVGCAVVQDRLPKDVVSEIDDLVVDRYETLIDQGGEAC